MTPEEFVSRFVDSLRQRAVNLRTYGALGPAQTCDQIATDLAAEFRHWWLAELTITEAAGESGYSEERLRQLARTGELPSKKAAGQRRHVRVARCDLPRRPRPKAGDAISSLEERLLRCGRTGLQKPA